MKLAKRIFIGIIVILCLAGVGYWWRYKQAYTFDQIISSQANLLIDIDLREVENTLLWDFFSNPFNGFSLEWPRFNQEDEEDDKTPDQGLSLPRHLIIFANSEQSDIFFTAPIEINGTKFSEYTDTMLARKNFVFMDSSLIYDTKKHLFYHWSEQFLSVAFAKIEQVEYTKKILRNLITKKNTKSLPVRFIQQIKNQNHHIRIWRKPSSITNDKPVLLYVDFQKGFLNIAGDIPFKYNFAQANQKIETSKEAVLGFYANLQWQQNGLKERLQKEISSNDFSKWTSMSLDSVLQYWNGEISIQVPSIESSIDSIITYEYDENFNKKEIITTKNVIKPKAQILFSTSKDSTFFRYVKSTGVIKRIEGEDRFVGFPFLKLFAKTKAQKLALSTEQNFNQSTNSASSKNFFSLESNLQAFPELLDFLPLKLNKEQKEKLKKLSIQCYQNTSGFHLEGKISTKADKRFFFGS